MQSVRGARRGGDLRMAAVSAAFLTLNSAVRTEKIFS